MDDTKIGNSIISDYKSQSLQEDLHKLTQTLNVVFEVGKIPLNVHKYLLTFTNITFFKWEQEGENMRMKYAALKSVIDVGVTIIIIIITIIIIIIIISFTIYILKTE